MKRKFFFIFGFLILFWFAMLAALFWSVKYTTIVQNSIRNKIIQSMPEGSDLIIGQIQGNLISGILLDSLYLNYDSLAILEMGPIEMNYSLWSLIKGTPHLSHINIASLKFSLEKKETVDSASAIIKPGADQFSLDKFEIPFSTVLPDTIHKVIRKTIHNLPDISLADLTIKRIQFKKQNNYFLKDGFLQAVIRPGFIKVKKFDGYTLQDLPIRSCSFECSYDEESIILSNFMLHTATGTIIGKMDIDISNRFEGLWVFDSITLKNDDFKKIWPKSKQIFDSVAVYSTGYIYLYPESLFFDIKSSGRFNKMKLDSASFKGKIDKKSIQIKQMSLHSNSGQLQGNVITAFNSTSWIDLQLSQFDLSALTNGRYMTRINSHLKMNFDRWDLSKLNGKLSIMMNESDINHVHLKKIKMSINARNGIYAIDSTSGAYLDTSAVFTLTGWFDSRLQGMVDLGFDGLNFNQLGRVLGIADLNGYGTGIFSFRGNLLNPDFHSYLELDSLGFKDLKGYGIEEKIHVKELVGNRLGRYKLDVLSGIMGPMEFTDAIVSLDINKNKISLDSLTFINNENYLDIKGAVRIQDSLFSVLLDRFRIDYKNITLQNHDTLRMQLTSDKFESEYFVLTSNHGGELEAVGNLNFDSTASSFAILMNNINLQIINQFKILPFRSSGEVSFEGLIEGNLKNPDLSLVTDFRNLALDTVNLGQISLSAELSDGVLEIPDGTWNLKNTSLSLNSRINLETFFNDSLQYSGDYIHMRLNSFNLGNFKKLFGFSYPFSGIVNSDIIFRNNIANLSGNGTMEITGFKLQNYSLDSLWTQFSYENNILAVKDGLLRSRGTELFFTYNSELDWDSKNKNIRFLDNPMRIFASTSTHSLGFLGDVNENVQNIRGDIQLNVEISGTNRNPILKDGNLQIKNADLYLYKLANTIRIEDLSGVITDNRLHFVLKKALAREQAYKKSLTSRFWNKLSNTITFWKKSKQDGLITANGLVDLSDLKRPDINLDLKLNNAYFNYFIENTEVVASSKNIHIQGRDTLLISGKINLIKGNYKLDLEQYEKNLLLNVSEREQPPYLTYDLDIDIPGNFYLLQENPLNSFNLQITGGLNVKKQPQELIENSGILEILDGELNLYGKNLKVTSGKISFVNPKELPEIDLEAELRQEPYYFEITEKGPLSNPELGIRLYDIQSGTEYNYDIKDKMSILVTGLPFSDVDKANFREQGMQALTTSLLSLFENKARKFTGLDKIQIGKLNNGGTQQSSKLSEGVGDEAYLSVGKYLTNNIYFEYKTGMTGNSMMGIGAPKLSWENGNEIQVNYRLSRMWSFGTNYAITLNGNRKIRFDLAWKIHF